MSQLLQSSANSKHVIRYDMKLKVETARPSDSGIYKCSGSNGTTTSDINVLLIVKGTIRSLI